MSQYDDLLKAKKKLDDLEIPIYCLKLGVPKKPGASIDSSIGLNITHKTILIRDGQGGEVCIPIKQLDNLIGFIHRYFCDPVESCDPQTPTGA